MDRADAIRLMRALAAAGMSTRAPKANAWIQKKALEIGLDGSQPNLTRAEADVRIAMLTAKLKLLDEPPHTL